MLALNAPGFSQFPVIDSTTYIYLSADLPVPLSKKFINFEYLSSSQEKSLTSSLKDESKSKKSNSNEINDFSIQYADFMLVLIIILFSILAYITFSGKNYLSRVVTSVFNYSYSISFFREKNLAFVINNFLLKSLFFISSAIILKTWTDYFLGLVPESYQWLQLLIYLAFSIGLVLIHNFVVKVLASLFGFRRMVEEYLFYVNNLFRITGIIFLIFILGGFFTSDSWKYLFIYLSVFISAIVYLIKISRIMFILFANRFSLYYLILYFCALEIIPVLLFIKFLKHFNYKAFFFADILVQKL